MSSYLSGYRVLFDEFKCWAVSVRARDDGSYMGVAKRRGPDGRAQVAYSQADNPDLTLARLVDAVRGDRWRRDTLAEQSPF